MAELMNLANVLQGVEGIKGARIQNALGQQQLDAQNMLMQQRAQFSPLYAEALTNQNAMNQLMQQAPQLGMEAMKQAQAMQAFQQAQFKQQAEEAGRISAMATRVMSSKSPKTLAMAQFPELVEAIEKASGEAWEDIDQTEFAAAMAEVRARADALSAPKPGATPAGVMEFNALTEAGGLSDEDRAKAARIDLGLEPRAGTMSSVKIVDVGDVPIAVNPNTGEAQPVKVGGQEVTAETVGENKAIVGEQETRGEGRGARANKAIAAAEEKFPKIQTNIRNINRAIEALDKGAKTGPVMAMLPSVKAASVALDQIQGELGLDIVGATTFGQLSKGELDLSMDTALPTKLPPKELRAWLVKKRDAQAKVFAYMQKQIQFIQNGGTVEEFLMKEAEAAGFPPGSVPLGDGTVMLPGGQIARPKK